jgi:DNA polymerase III subunit gamma/tau
MSTGNIRACIIESERPTRFEKVVGQDALIGTLRERIREDQSLDRHLAFVGPAGSGKLTIARLYSQAIVCEALHEDRSPCQTCTECKGVLAESSFAYVLVDAIKHDDEEAMRTLVEGDGKLNMARVRVVLFQNAERLVPSAADAALKTLERETNTVFIFLANDERTFSGALRSRCQAFRVRPVEADLLVHHLTGVCPSHPI